MSKKHAGYVFIPIKPETRTALNNIKVYGDTYDTAIIKLLEAYYGEKWEDHAAQNIDDTRDENG